MGFYLARELKRTNPYDTGRSRRGWTLKSYQNGNVVVFNKVHYVQYLEAGHSKQAPNGFIQQSIAKTKRWMNSLSPEEPSSINFTGKAVDRLLEAATIKTIEQRSSISKTDAVLTLPVTATVSDETVASLINTLIEEGKRKNTLPAQLKRKIRQLLIALGVIRG